MRLSTRTAVLAVPFVLAGQALAGDFHNGTQLLCNQCHIMHFSISHQYGGSGPDGGILGGTPNGYLLREEVNTLCLSCHDNDTGAPDVLGTNGGSQQGIVRSAGYLNSILAGNTQGDTWTGHTLGSTDDPPGWDGGAGTYEGGSPNLGCTDCHDQHGWGGPSDFNQYRNLVWDPGGDTNAGVGWEVSYEGTATNAEDVLVRTILQYDESEVDWQEPDTSGSAIADWCKGCHNNFHGIVTGPEIGGTLAGGAFIRHPAAEVDLGGIGGGHSTLAVYTDPATTARVKMMDATGNWGVGSTGVTPTCISCHKGHGNGNSFGLIFRDPADPTITEEGSTGGLPTTPQDLCKQCHVQADAF